MVRKISYLLLLLAIMSCSHMNSGHYVQLKNGESLKSLAKELKVPEWKLKAANKGRRIASGSWVFVPLNWGVANSSSSYYETQEFLSSGEFLWPVPAANRISSKFGHRWGKKHEGIDIAARSGSHILAASDGVVVYSGNGLGGYGNLTVLAHEGGLFSVYAHATKNFTHKGQKVHRGQVIATIGTTGRSTGPHLHFEIRHNGRAVNPQRFLAYRH